MEQELIERCNLLAENSQILSKQFKWDMDMMVHAASAIITSKLKSVEPEEMNRCLKLLKDRTEELSEYRGNLKTVILSKMALSSDPEKYLDSIDQIYKVLNKRHLIGNEHKLLAAMTICEHKQPEEYKTYIDRTNEIYERMKKKHAFLTSDEDIPFAAMLAVSDLPVDQLVVDMEAMYASLKKSFYDNNAVQSLSHVMCLAQGSPEEKCAKAMEIYNGLKAKKHRLGSGYELAVLGALVAVPLPANEIVEQVAAADDLLKTKKGFGDVTLGDTYRRLFASLMVIDTYKKNCLSKEEIMLGSVISITITIEICMMLLMLSATTTVTT